MTVTEHDPIEDIQLKSNSDMPTELKEQLKTAKTNEDDDKIKKLFKSHHELTIDEIIIALWNKYKINRKRSWYIARLHQLKKSKFIFKKPNSKKIFVIASSVAGIEEDNSDE